MLPRLSRSLYTTTRKMAASPYTVVSTDKAPAAIGPYVQVSARARTSGLVWYDADSIGQAVKHNGVCPLS